MKTFLWIGVAAIVAVGGFLALNAYIYQEKQGETTENPIDTPIVGELEEGGEADPARMTLTMTEWRWMRATVDGKEVRPKNEGQFTITFDDTARFSVKTDCNQMGGKYTWNEGRITFTEIMSTLMYCEGSQEGIFGEILADAKGYRFTSRGEMILELASGGTATFR